jgi:hypothetical protein
MRSFLRDNPIQPKTAREPKAEEEIVAPKPSVPAEPKVRFIINNKQLKVVERLFGKRAGKVRWEEVTNVS